MQTSVYLVITVNAYTMKKEKLLPFKLFFSAISNTTENYKQEHCLFLKSLTLTKLARLFFCSLFCLTKQGFVLFSS